MLHNLNLNKLRSNNVWVNINLSITLNKWNLAVEMKMKIA